MTENTVCLRSPKQALSGRFGGDCSTGNKALIKAHTDTHTHTQGVGWARGLVGQGDMEAGVYVTIREGALLTHVPRARRELGAMTRISSLQGHSRW